MENRKSRINWLDHSIGFMSALFGIFIAFQLQDYQDNNREKEKLNITLSAIKNETENNLMIYSRNIEILSDWLNYYQNAITIRNEREVKVRRADYERKRIRYPERYKNWELLRSENDSILVFSDKSGVIHIDILPETGVSTSSWQAGIYSGILNRLDSKKLVTLTKIYDWFSKDLGLDDRDFLMDLVIDQKITDLNKIVEYYRRVIKIQGIKYEQVNSIYCDLLW